MSLLSGGTSTLTLFAWVFFILSGAVGVVEEIYTISQTGFDPLHSTWQILVNLLSLGAGTYFVIHRKTLFPRYRKEVLYALGGFFLFGILQSLYLIAQTYINPGALDSTISAQDLQKQVAMMTALGTLFSALIYYIIFQSVNEVSGIGKGPAMPARWLTVLGWVIIIGMVAGVAYYGLSM